MGLFGDIVNTFKDAASGVSDFASGVVDTLKNDGKDIVRASQFTPGGLLLNAVTGGGHRALVNDAFRAMGVSEEDIQDMDYRNHSVLDNARAFGNSLFNVGTTLVGGPAIKAGATAAAKGASAGIKAISATTKAAKGTSHAAKAAKAAVKPSQWVKSTTTKRLPGSAEILKRPAKLDHIRAVPGQPPQKVYKGRTFTQPNSTVPHIYQIETKPGRVVSKTRVTNPTAAEEIRRTKKAFSSSAQSAKAAFGDARTAIKTVRSSPKALVLATPHIENATEAEYKKKGLRKAVKSGIKLRRNF